MYPPIYTTPKTRKTHQEKVAEQRILIKKTKDVATPHLREMAGPSRFKGWLAPKILKNYASKADRKRRPELVQEIERFA